MRRIAIYFFYDNQGIVDEYNIVMLEDIRKNVDYLLVVVNGIINEQGIEKFNKVADQIYVRDNKGFDVWAYREGILKIGWEELNNYDELVLFNFTNYGPVYPFQEMFMSMDKRSIDFWGITKHYGLSFDPYKKCKYGYLPEHIQSSFMVIRKNLIISQDFQKYWNDMPMINDYAEAICCHEAIFTEDFHRLGYTSDVYVDTDDLKDYSDYPLMLYPLELIKNRRCPIFKRKTFYNQYEEFLDVSCGQAGYELYEYLRLHTEYDIDLIWDNLLRTVNMYDIKQRMQLNYILPSDVNLKSIHPRKKTALFIHLYYEDKIEYCKKYADSMPSDSDIYITIGNKNLINKINQVFNDLSHRIVKIIEVENRGRDVSALLIGLKDYVTKYDYVCFVHDKKANYDKPYLIGESFSYQCFENVLSSKDFVENVITTFDDNPRLGLLVPPTPLHGSYYNLVGLEWQSNFALTKEKAKEWNITVDIDDTKAPIAPYGTNFWFRSDALKPLYDLNLKYEDFPEEPIPHRDGTIMHVIERMYPFASQQNGYYTGWLLSDIYAKMEVTNLYKMLRDINQTLFWNFGVSDRYTLMHTVSVVNQKAITLSNIASNNDNNTNNCTNNTVSNITPQNANFKYFARRIIGNSLYHKLWQVKQKLLRKDR